MSTFVSLLAPKGKGALVRPDNPVAAGGAGASPGTITRAELSVHEPKPDGTAGAVLDTITLQFNPTSIKVSKSSGWSPTEAKTAAPATYQAWKPCTIVFDVFLDATGTSDKGVVEMAERLQACCQPTQQSKDKPTASPPLVRLTWGPLTSFDAYITDVTVTYDLFRADGMPIRASCTLTLTEMFSAEARQNPTSGSEAVRRVHRTAAGDTLASVAYAEYGDPACWRPLAQWNGIDDPLRVAIGTVVQLPSAAELLRPAGPRR